MRGATCLTLFLILTTAPGCKPKGNTNGDPVRQAAAEAVKAADAMKKEDWDETIKLSSGALDLDSENTSARWMRGVAYLQKKEYDKAIADFDGVIKREPKEPPSWRDRGKAWSRKKEYAKAIADFTEYIRLRPNDPEGYEGRALARWNSGDKKGASPDLAKAKELRGKGK